MREPLLPPLAAIAAGIAVSRFVHFESRELALPIAAFALLGVFCYWRRFRLLAGVCALLGCVAGGILLDALHRPGPPPEIDTDSRTTVIVSGCVVEPPVFFDGREQFTLELEPGARARVNLYLREGEAPPPLRYGQRVELEARLRKARNFRNPGAFDYAGYLARRDIYWIASARTGAEITILPGACGSRLDAFVYRIRGAALEKIERMYAGRPYETAMMQALLLGESSKLEKAWTEDFRRTGTFHALVISGTQVAVLAALLQFLLRICMVGRIPALAVTSAAAWGYALLTGWQTPVIRAAAGLTLYLIGRSVYRRTRVVNLLAAIALVFLIADPGQLFDPSFQLSFLAVAFLGAVAAPAIERTSGPLLHGAMTLGQIDRDRRMPPRVAQFRVELRLLAETIQMWTRWPQRVCRALVAAPAAALLYLYEAGLASAAVQAGLALPMAVYFHRVSISGLTANALIIPAMGAAVPAGFASILTGWALPGELAAWMLAFSRRVVASHARWEPDWRIPGPPLWLAVALTVALIALAWSQRGAARWRIAASACVASLLAVLVWHPFEPNVRRGELEISAIDVGQGESLLITFPDGKLMLMDAGGIPTFGRRARPRLDIGEDVVSPYLWSRSIRKVDVVAVSHAHEDHIGGLDAVLENFQPKELWTGAGGLDRRGVRVKALKRGDAFEFGGVLVEALSPPGPGAANPNDDSLALRLTYGGRSALLTGDVERRVERELVRGGLGVADILKVAHHGSRTSSTPDLLDAVRPSFAIISAGYENPYGHPHRDVVTRLAERGVATLRTDALGLVTVRTDGRRIEIDAARWSGQTGALATVW